MGQGWDQMYDTEKDDRTRIDEELINEVHSGWVTVFPIFVEKRLKDSEVKYDQSLAYIASTEEKAKEWCKANTDTESHNDAEHWWWFAVTQEAIDGEYSGIKGLVALLDWDGNDIAVRPVKGYEKEAVKEAKVA